MRAPQPALILRIANLFASGRITFGLKEGVIVATLAVAVSVAGALLHR